VPEPPAPGGDGATPKAGAGRRARAPKRTARAAGG
jgi:hypothetical protein